MNFRFEPLLGNFGAQADVELEGLSDPDLVRLLDALYENRFLVLRTGGLSKTQLVSFARRLGEPIGFDPTREHPEIIPISNVGIDTQKDKSGAAHWHTDQSFTTSLSSMTMLYSIQAPKHGGATQFCNLAAAYAALPMSTQQVIEDLVVEHRHGVSIVVRPDDHTPIPPKGWDQSRTVFHPLVRHHPITGQQTLYAISGTSQGIKDMSDKEATELLTELCEHTLQDQFITAYEHCVDDLVLWDNPTTMHRATPIPEATGPADTRLIDRISLRGTPSVFAR